MLYDVIHTSSQSFRKVHDWMASVGSVMHRRADSRAARSGSPKNDKLTFEPRYLGRADNPLGGLTFNSITCIVGVWQIFEGSLG